jgi:hypothetical protein
MILVCDIPLCVQRLYSIQGWVVQHNFDLLVKYTFYIHNSKTKFSAFEIAEVLYQ